MYVIDGFHQMMNRIVAVTLSNDNLLSLEKRVIRNGSEQPDLWDSRKYETRRFGVGVNLRTMSTCYF